MFFLRRVNNSIYIKIHSIIVAQLNYTQNSIVLKTIDRAAAVK